jgi:glycine reductase
VEDYMSEKIRVLHYLNQFFGGIGAEEEAHTPIQIQDGPVGPGRLLQQILGDRGTVVATVIGGDDYVAENEDEAGLSIESALAEHRPDLVIAGPAFDSGRYGMGCALVCRVAGAASIPAVTGMHPDNAAVITHRRDMIAVPTGTNPAEMRSIIENMAALGLKLAEGEELGPAAEDGYIPRGIRKLVLKEKRGYQRAIDMLLARVAGQPFTSEILVQKYDDAPSAAPLKNLSDATIAIVVSTGIVPRGNPDSVPGARSLEAGRYSIEGLDNLTVESWESVHGGFNTRILNTQNPNYALPLSSLRQLESEGVFKNLYPYFFSTVGNQTAVGPARDIGQRIAEELKSAGVSGAIQVSG